MPLRKQIRTGYVIAFILLMISYFFIFRSTRTVQREYDWLTNSYKAENKIGELKSSIVEAETSVRGYYITKDKAFLGPYNESQQNIPSIYNELKTLDAENPKQLLV